MIAQTIKKHHYPSSGLWHSHREIKCTDKVELWLGHPLFNVSATLNASAAWQSLVAMSINWRLPLVDVMDV